MVNSVIPKNSAPEIKVNTNKVLTGLSIAFILIVGLSILQDLVETNRSGYAFYFSESLLFKTVWILFIPLLSILYYRLQGENLIIFRKTTFFIITPIVIHILFVPLIAFVFSVLFFEGRYDLYKFFSYTVTNDLDKIVIIYTGFVLSYKYFTMRSTTSGRRQENGVLEKIIINNGKNNTIVYTKDILQITAATPYIFIHLENKKYLHSETLKSICGQLDNNNFIQIHKSTVVNIAKVKSFKSRLNGDYDLLLKNGHTVRLSRTYSANFKKHFKTGQQDTIYIHQVK